MLTMRRVTKATELKRFTILSGPGERRNLASECLGLVARELPRLWLKKFHYRPLLAKTFCDIKRAAGTCYKAAGRIPLGQTQGFTRVNRQDTEREILCSGGEHLMQVKGNQPGIVAKADAVVKARHRVGPKKTPPRTGTDGSRRG